MKIVIAIDSFKGSLSAHQAALAVAEGVRMQTPDTDVVVLPISDGGEGAMEVVTEALGGEVKSVAAVDGLMRPVEARYGLLPGGKAVVELAEASGLGRLSFGERNPLETTSFGTGMLVLDALRSGAREVLITLGGSATNDGGMGLLSALGFRFIDKEGRVLRGCGGDLSRVEGIDEGLVEPLVCDAHFTVAVDVTSPMLGPSGAAQVFAPQKGADDGQVALLEGGMEHYVEVLERHTQRSVGLLSGSGAAGGVAGALVALLGARMVGGADMILDAVGLDEALAGADVVITGEGRMDCQTALGKAPSRVAQRAAKKGVRCVALCGSVERCKELQVVGFDQIVAITPTDMPLSEAMLPAVAYDLLRRAAAGLKF